MKTLNVIALTLTIIGAINWGLIGLFDFNLVALIFGGADSLFTKIIIHVILHIFYNAVKLLIRVCIYGIP